MLGVEAKALLREVLDLAARYFALGHLDVQLNFFKSMPAGEDIVQSVSALAQLQSLPAPRGRELVSANSQPVAIIIFRNRFNCDVQVFELLKKVHCNSMGAPAGLYRGSARPHYPIAPPFRGFEPLVMRSGR